MMESLWRFLFVWSILNAVLLLLEWFKWQKCKRSHWSWKGFLDHYVWDLTYIVLMLDIVMVGLFVLYHLLYWIFEPSLV